MAIDVPRYKDRADFELLPELERGIQAVARTIQADVHQRGFGSLSLRHAYGLLGASCYADHLDWMEREGKNGDVQIVLNREAIERARLRVDTRKWVLTKIRPDRFGDKLEQTHKGDTALLALSQSMSGGKPRDDD